MRKKRVLWSVAAGVALIVAGSSAFAFAHSGGGGGGGGHGGGGHHGGGYHGLGIYGGGGYPAGWRGRWRGGGDGYGWYAGGFYGGSGGLRYGLLFATLPWYCETYWWGGVPYYYADDNYYQWNDGADAYETVEPPLGLVDQLQTQAPATRELFIFPDAGQSNEQLARDREDCHRWAAAQVGFDPRAAAAGSAGTAATSSSSADATAAKRADYLRADGACLIGRNYSVQ